MMLVPLSAIPNQSFSIQLDNNIFDMTIRFVVNFMAIDLSINNSVLLSGLRIVPGFPIIPYQYLEEGNFLINTLNNEYPNYTQFGITQFMFYISQADLEAARAAATA
jgi:hypothetical protein